MRIERYIIEKNPRSITIILDQKKNALINMLISLIVILGASYMVRTVSENEGFFYVLIVVGVLWFFGAIKGYKAKSRYDLDEEGIKFKSISEKDPLVTKRVDMDHVAIHKIIRLTGRQRHENLILRWRVKIMDKQGLFNSEFKFQDEKYAEKMAAILSDFYRLDIKRAKL